MKTDIHEIQRYILTKIKFFQTGARYSDIKIDNIENDLYNYHLQQLVKNKLVEKIGDLYQLTQSGKSLVTNIDEEDQKLPPSYKVSVYLVLINRNQILLSKRLKHPQYGYVGLPSGKIKYGEDILATANRELMEETGLTADFKIIGNLRQVRRNNAREVIEDGVFYICYSNVFKGQLITHQLEGENFWVDLDKVNQIEKIFKPSVEIVVNEVAKRTSGAVDWNQQFIYELTPEPEDY